MVRPNSTRNLMLILLRNTLIRWSDLIETCQNIFQTVSEGEPKKFRKKSLKIKCVKYVEKINIQRKIWMRKYFFKFGQTQLYEKSILILVMNFFINWPDLIKTCHSKLRLKENPKNSRKSPKSNCSTFFEKMKFSISSFSQKIS